MRALGAISYEFSNHSILTSHKSCSLIIELRRCARWDSLSMAQRNQESLQQEGKPTVPPGVLNSGKEHQL